MNDIRANEVEWIQWSYDEVKFIYFSSLFLYKIPHNVEWWGRKLIEKIQDFRN